MKIFRQIKLLTSKQGCCSAVNQPDINLNNNFSKSFMCFYKSSSKSLNIKDVPDLKEFIKIKKGESPLNSVANEKAKISDESISKNFEYLSSYNQSRLLTEPQNYLFEEEVEATEKSLDNSNTGKNAQVQIKFFLETYGCQMNENDSEIISTILTANNYIKAETMEDVSLKKFVFLY